MKKSILLTLFMVTLMPTAFSPAKAQDLVYVPVNPCRIVDTRNAGGVIPANSFRNFRVSGTVGQLAVQGGTTNCLDPKTGTGLTPLAISAYVLAVPAPGSINGVLTAYPSNLPPPPAGSGSTVNFAAGQVIGNTTMMTLCDSSCPTNGEFAVLARNTNQHVVVDVQGYFYPASLGTCPSNTPTRFVDNGDGTICDSETGFMWEKKDAADGVQNLSNPHDVDNTYYWAPQGSSGTDRTKPYGTVFTDFLARLNNTGASSESDTPFAGYTDWRIPPLFELQTLLLEPYPCSINPCIDPMFIIPASFPFPYWSSTSYLDNLFSAWIIRFIDGQISWDTKDGGSLTSIFGFHVRAVRNGR